MDPNEYERVKLRSPFVNTILIKRTELALWQKISEEQLKCVRFEDTYNMTSKELNQKLQASSRFVRFQDVGEEVGDSGFAKGNIPHKTLFLYCGMGYLVENGKVIDRQTLMEQNPYRLDFKNQIINATRYQGVDASQMGSETRWFMHMKNLGQNNL